MFLHITKVSAQNPVHVTSSMARKIGYLYRHNPRFNTLAYEIMRTNSIRKVDVTLRTLENNLALATKFLVQIAWCCDSDDITYLMLKEAGFTLQEHQLADRIISIETEISRKRQIAQEKQEQKERIVRAKRAQEEELISAEQGAIFNSKSVTRQALVSIDISNLSKRIEEKKMVHQMGYKPINCGFDFVVTKDGKMYLSESEDSARFSENDIFIYNYIMNNYIVQQSAQKYFNLLDTTVDVNVVLNIQVFEESVQNDKTINFFALRDKKKSDWTIADSLELKQKLSDITTDRLEVIYRDVVNLLSTQVPFINSKKNRYQVKLNVIENQIHVRLNDKIYECQQLPFSFDFLAIPISRISW